MVMSSNAMWYKNGNFYEVPTTHINFSYRTQNCLVLPEIGKKDAIPLGWLYELP